MHNTSSLQTRMKRLFTEGFTAIDIAEPLFSFDADKDGLEVQRIMDDRNVTVAGVRTGGMVTGYVEHGDLTSGTCGDHARAFDEDHIRGETASFTDIINVLAAKKYCFLSVLTTVGGVITRDDIQKHPVRMWLFGMITIIEMFLTRTIKKVYPDGSWKQELSERRLERAEHIRDERERRKQHPDLLDCLQLGDKAYILMKRPDIREDAGFESRKAGEQAIKEVESLRNNLAHAQDILTHNWDAIVTIANRLEKIMTRI